MSSRTKYLPRCSLNGDLSRKRLVGNDEPSLGRCQRTSRSSRFSKVAGDISSQLLCLSSSTPIETADDYANEARGTGESRVLRRSTDAPFANHSSGQIDRTYEEAIGGIGDCAKDVGDLSSGERLRLSWIPARSISLSAASVQPRDSLFFACNCSRMRVFSPCRSKFLRILKQLWDIDRPSLRT